METTSVSWVIPINYGVTTVANLKPSTLEPLNLVAGGGEVIQVDGSRLGQGLGLRILDCPLHR